MKYKVKIEQDKDVIKSDGTCYSTWEDIYEQQVEELDIRALIAVVNRVPEETPQSGGEG